MSFVHLFETNPTWFQHESAGDRKFGTAKIYYPQLLIIAIIFLSCWTFLKENTKLIQQVPLLHSENFKFLHVQVSTSGDGETSMLIPFSLS